VVTFGHCGGRPLLTRLEADVCRVLDELGLAHAHRPRHFEVQLAGEKVGAFSPDIVVRGRGREGKTVVFEAIESLRDPDIDKLEAFRRQYGQEFYVIMVAREDYLYKISPDCFDEDATPETIGALLGRMVD